MEFPIHSDEAGSFQELAHDNDVEFGQLSILRVNPGCTRGGHYHLRKTEWFCCVYGRGELELIDIETGKKQTHILDGSKGRKFIKVLPGFSHTVINRNLYVDLEVLIIISEKYNPESADTHLYKKPVLNVKEK